jgi:hypothetical protein
MYIGHINIQSEYATSILNVTSTLNQYNQSLVGRFGPKPLSFNLTHNQPPQFYLLTIVLYPN